MTRPPVGAVLRGLVIDAIDDEGRGRAVCVDGDVVLDVAVRGALPGDVVDARVERVWAARGLAQARRLGDPGVEPPHAPRTCAHRGPCPACPLHGGDDGFVLAFKRARVEAAFRDAGIGVHVAPTLPGTGRRQKVKLVAGGRAGHLVLGHYVPHTHVIVDASGCAYADDEILAALDALRGRLDALRLGPPLLHAVIARRFVEGVAVVLVASAPPPVPLARLRPEGVRGLSWRVPTHDQSDNAIVGGDVLAHDGDVTGTPLSGGPVVDVDTFCQADAGAARALVERAADFVLADGGDDVVLDLFAGTGAFAHALAARGRRVIAVESFPASAMALSRIDRVTPIAACVEDTLETLAAHAPRACIADPPRKGLGAELVRALAALPLRRVALVSCDVDAGARDVVALRSRGFTIDAVVPVDLFPGSAEVEVLTLLRRG